MQALPQSRDRTVQALPQFRVPPRFAAVLGMPVGLGHAVPRVTGRASTLLAPLPPVLPERPGLRLTLPVLLVLQVLPLLLRRLALPRRQSSACPASSAVPGRPRLGLVRLTHPVLRLRLRLRLLRGLRSDLLAPPVPRSAASAEGAGPR